MASEHDEVLAIVDRALYAPSGSIAIGSWPITGATPARLTANAESVTARGRQTRVSVPCPVASNAELVSAVATPLGPTVNLTIAG